MKSNMITTHSTLPQISVWLSLQVNLLLSRIPQRVVSVCLLQLLLCIQMLPLVLNKCDSKCFTSFLVVRLTVLPRHASPMTLEPIPSLPSSCRSFCCTSKSCPSAPSVRRLPPRRPGFETRHATDNHLHSDKFCNIYLDAGRVFAILLGIHDAPLHGDLAEVGIEAEVGQNVLVGVVTVCVVLGESLGDENGKVLESCPENGHEKIQEVILVFNRK